MCRAIDCPLTEPLADTIERSLPSWDGEIAPRLDAGQRVLLVAHGNSLRALVKHLDQMDDKTIAGLGIPTGVPLLYRLDTSLRPIEHHYLGDAETRQEIHRSPQGPVQGHDASAPAWTGRAAWSGWTHRW